MTTTEDRSWQADLTTLPTTATFAHVMLSELTKLRTLRSTIYTMILTVFLGVIIGFLFSEAGASAYLAADEEQRAGFDPTMTSLQGYIFAQLAIGVLGVLVVTSEYATGMVRTSVTVVPRRIRLLAAKATVFSLVALVIGNIVGFGAFALGQAHLGTRGAARADISDPAVLRAIIGCGLYLAAVGLIGVALGVLLRATAGALAVLIAIALLLPVLATALPASWQDPILKWWPTTAGSRVMTVVPEPAALSPWAGYAVLILFVAALLGAACLVLHRRDA
jgi:ABC-type transport system involved in multi-copper enzyme maturation permease subunit